MVIRQRAIQVGDKEERHHAILDAAERLLLGEPERIANMAEVATEAGVAKGTVYLYFPSKSFAWTNALSTRAPNWTGMCRRCVLGAGQRCCGIATR